MIEIKQMLVPDNKKPKYVVNGKEVIIHMVPEWITIHETDNQSPTADDLAHARLQLNGNSRNASWHLQVDDDSCIQSIPFNECALHAGDNTGTGNMKSIAIEICVNKDGDYQKAVSNASEVTKQLMKQFNIPLDHVVQHNHWSGKDCPRHLRAGDKGIKWEDFLQSLQEPKDTTKYRLRSGHFSNASDLAKALDSIKKDYGWLTYEKADSTDLNPSYRFITGTFEGRELADKMAKVLHDKYGWLIYVDLA